MSESKNINDNEDLSIGDAARASGISAFNLRTWERRYGLLVSTKLPSGHRRYCAKDIERLRKIKAALDVGGKISKLVELSDKELDDFHRNNEGAQSISEKAVVRLVDIAESWDDSALQAAFDSEWQALGPMGFVNERAIRLLKFIGQGWEKGDVSIAQETLHFGSSREVSFLISGAKINQGNREAKILMCSLEGEDHAFGIHFCAVACALSGHKIIYLGPSLPDEEIVNTAVASDCFAVCLSISKLYNPQLALGKLKRIRKSLPQSVDIVIGGAGAPRDIKGIRTIDRCQNLIRLG